MKFDNNALATWPISSKKTSHQLIEGKFLNLELFYKLVHQSVGPLLNRLPGTNAALLHGSVNPHVSRQTEPKVNSCIKCQQLALVAITPLLSIHKFDVRLLNLVLFTTDNTLNL